MKKFFLLATSAFVLFSCKKSDNKSGTFNGPEVSVQHGTGYTWVKLDNDGKPLQLGISLNDAALNSMPVGHGEPTGGHTHPNSVIFPLDARAKAATPFNHVGVDWNPNGHEPEHIYDKPHFDFHFYMVTEAEKNSFTDLTKLENDPAAEFLPLNHIGGAPVPAMGKHWIDATSPELGGAPFKETFIYGSYNGKVVFYEPMITLDFLKNTSSYERPIAQPARFKQAGYYPTKMSVKKQGDVTNVILEGFVKRNAS